MHLVSFVEGACTLAFVAEKKAMQEGVFSIEDAFGDLRDPRGRTPAHEQTEILVAALRAILSTGDS